MLEFILIHIHIKFTNTCYNTSTALGYASGNEVSSLEHIAFF